MEVKYTQIFFDNEMKVRKEKADITWNDAAFLGVTIKEKMNQLGISTAEDFLNTLNHLTGVKQNG